MPEHSIEKLIRVSRETPVPWLINNLWQQGGIAIVHSLEEEFKSIATYQIAECVANGRPLLRTWAVPRKRRVGVFETEMDDLETGRRLSIMYPDGDFPRNLVVSDTDLMKEFRSRHSLSEKMDCVDAWAKAQGVEVLVWDTVNSILAATGKPNDEVALSRFFDQLGTLNLKGALLVRHDSKPSRDTAERESNQLVRGSNRIVEDASLVIHLKREDKASHKVCLTVGKLRNARKPESMQLWFDAGNFRLTPIPPAAALLEEGPITREEMLSKGFQRFGLKERAMDEQRRQMASYIDESMEGHKRVFALKGTIAIDSESPRWVRLLQPLTPPQELQRCISNEGIYREENAFQT